MHVCYTLRRDLIRFLALCVVVQLGLVGVSEAAYHATAAGRSGHRIAAAHRVTSWAGVRSQRSASAPSHLDSWQPGLREACCDVYPQWTVSILAKRNVSPVGLLPIHESRFGRAPPSLFL
jgi:hypothetical protein